MNNEEILRKIVCECVLVLCRSVCGILSAVSRLAAGSVTNDQELTATKRGSHVLAGNLFTCMLQFNSCVNVMYCYP